MAHQQEPRVHGRGVQLAPLETQRVLQQASGVHCQYMCACTPAHAIPSCVLLLTFCMPTLPLHLHCHVATTFAMRAPPHHQTLDELQQVRRHLRQPFSAKSSIEAAIARLESGLKQQAHEVGCAKFALHLPTRCMGLDTGMHLSDGVWP